MPTLDPFATEIPVDDFLALLASRLDAVLANFTAVPADV